MWLAAAVSLVFQSVNMSLNMGHLAEPRSGCMKQCQWLIADWLINYSTSHTLQRGITSGKAVIRPQCFIWTVTWYSFWYALKCRILLILNIMRWRWVMFCAGVYNLNNRTNKSQVSFQYAILTQTKYFDIPHELSSDILTRKINSSFRSSTSNLSGEKISWSNDNVAFLIWTLLRELKFWREIVWPSAAREDI